MSFPPEPLRYGTGRPRRALRGAQRELREETGYISDSWEPLLTLPANATLSDNYAYLFRARNCRKGCAQELDETELIDVQKYTEEELSALIRDGQFQQAVHVLAWLLAKEREG